MPFTPKDWRNLPETSTPITAEALEDLETRVSGYADTRVASVESDVARLVADASKPIGIYAGAVADDSTDNTNVINAHLATGKHVFLPGNGIYRHGNLTFPVQSHGGQIMFGEGASRTKLSYTGTGHGITFGDGGATDTRFQSIQHMELIGNASALSGVRFNTTRWCSVKSCDVRGYTNASAHAVLIEGSTAARANYFNVLEDVQFSTNRSHVKLHGNADGTGANSNYLHRCHFSDATDQNVLIDGGDTNRLYKCEHGDATSPLGVKIIGNANFNAVEDNMFDGPTKAWDIASTAAETELIWNKAGSGSTSISTSTDASTTTIRRDKYTETARVSVYHASNQSLTTGTVTTLVFNTEDYDPQAMHVAGSTSDLTAPVAGVYYVTLRIEFAANATGVRMARVAKNGDTPVVAEESKDPPADGTTTGTVTLSFDIQLAAGDFLRARAYQTSGGALNVLAGNSTRAQFQMRRVG